jgi:uncharacterized membrane protein
MKPSKLEAALSLGGSLFMLVAVFYQPIGLPEWFQWVAFALTAACLIPLLILQKRRRGHRLRGDITSEPTHQSRWRFWLLLVLLVIGSLSGPLWLPYTGVTLPFSMLVVTSIISCVVLITVFLLAWRYWRPGV